MSKLNVLKKKFKKLDSEIIYHYDYGEIVIISLLHKSILVSIGETVSIELSYEDRKIYINNDDYLHDISINKFGTIKPILITNSD